MIPALTQLAPHFENFDRPFGLRVMDQLLIEAGARNLPDAALQPFREIIQRQYLAGHENTFLPTDRRFNRLRLTQFRELAKKPCLC